MLDMICKFCKDYHVVQIGVGLIALAAFINLVFYTILGKKRWRS